MLAAAVFLHAFLISVKITHINDFEFIYLYYPENWEMGTQGGRGEVWAGKYPVLICKAAIKMFIASFIYA